MADRTFRPLPFESDAQDNERPNRPDSGRPDLTGRALALTRGRGKKIGLKRIGIPTPSARPVDNTKPPATPDGLKTPPEGRLNPAGDARAGGVTPYRPASGRPTIK